MSKQISIKITVVAIILCLYQISALAAANIIFFSVQDGQCKVIVTNYMNAIRQYNSILLAMIPLSDDSHVTNALTNANQGITNKNITYNALQTYTGAIESALKQYPNKLLDPGNEQLESQLASMHTRVEQWKKGNNSCREKHGCLLGQPGYCSNE
jgi:hypothetical protein